MPNFSLNRTILELKLINSEYCKSQRQTLNRTILELKQKLHP